MVDKTDMNGNSTTESRSPPVAVANNTMELLSNVVSLGELQLRLFGVDLGRGLNAAAVPGMVLLAGGILALGSVPIVLVFLAVALKEATQLTYAQSFGLTALGSLVTAIILIAGALASLKSSWNHMFDCSITEWKNNASWIKGLIRRLSRQTSHSPRNGNGRY